jgi:hypothetical protein
MNPLFEITFDAVMKHWAYRIRGTNLTDCGYGAREDAVWAARQRVKVYLAEKQVEVKA